MSGLTFIVLMLAATRQEKAAPPDAAAQAQAEKLIRDIFKDELAKKSPADRVALAKKFIAQALQTDDDAAARFVLLREAREAARDAGDWAVAFQAIEEMGRRYDTEVVSAKLTVHVAIAKAAKTPEESGSEARALLALADDAIDAELWDVAAKAATEASANARKAKLLPLTTKAEAKAKQVSERQAWSAKVAKAAEKLEKFPEDSDANLIVGRQEALFKGEWDRGLPLLAKGSDPALKAAAAKDQEFPDEVPTRVACADTWWEFAEKETDATARINFRARAFYWYERASESATGLVKTKILQRMEAIRLDRFHGTWVDVTDPTLFGLQGKPGDPIAIVTKKGDGRRASLQKFPKGDFDGVSVRIRFGQVPGPCAAVWFSSADEAVSLFTAVESAGLVTTLPGGSRTVAKRVPLAAKTEFTVIVVLSRGEFVAHIDGEEIGRLPAKTAGIIVGLQGEDGSVTFDQIKIRRRE